MPDFLIVDNFLTALDFFRFIVYNRAFLVKDEFLMKL